MYVIISIIVFVLGLIVLEILLKNRRPKTSNVRRYLIYENIYRVGPNPILKDMVKNTNIILL